MNFEDILNDYNGLIWHTINNFVRNSSIPFDHTDDIYQESCSRIAELLPEYDAKISGIKTFIVSNTNVACMRYRRTHFKHAVNELKSDADISKLDLEQGVYDVIEEYDTSPLNKLVITKKYWGFTQQEIANEFHISQSTVSRILSDFRDYLTDILKKD